MVQKRPKGRQWIWWILGGCVLLSFIVFWRSLGEFRVFLPYLGKATGMFTEDRRYLLVIQNDAEQRPTGGFVTAYGFLEFHGGFPRLGPLQDVYSLQGYRDEQIRPMPAPMEFFFEDPFFKGYSFHDGNFSPDFPTSAQEMIRLYQEDEEAVHIDGVIAINVAFFERLLGWLGGVTVDNVRYTEENFFMLAEYEVNNMDRHNVEALASRKDLVGAVQREVMDRIVPWRVLGVRKIMEEGLAHKEIQMYFVDERLQRVAQARGWSGALWEYGEGTEGIFGVNIANLGAGKSDRYVEKDYYYDVRFVNTVDGPALRGQVRVVLRHLGGQNIPVSFQYRGWMRTYLPAGAVLGQASAEVTVEEALGHVVLGQMVEVSPGQSVSVVYDVELPLRLVEQGTLRQFIHVQSGAHARYHLTVSAPSDQWLESDDFSVKDHMAVFSGSLPRDRWMEVQLGTDALPPRVSLQRFDGRDSIILQFNEPIGEEFCTPEVFRLRDTNKERPDINDEEPRVVTVVCEDREWRLGLAGVRAQTGEHFQLTLLGVEDLAGNSIVPWEKEITVVQR